jgi:hypothetical protein
MLFAVIVERLKPSLKPLSNASTNGAQDLRECLAAPSFEFSEVKVGSKMPM